MKPCLFAIPALLGLAVAAPALAQQLPTVAQAQAADTRQGSYFDAYGSTIFYQVSGSGTPLVLIHGYPLSGALFSYQQAALSSRFTVITLDLPGFGKSSPAVGGNGSPALYARYVLALMDHLNLPKAIIGGHSMGGIITEELYREAPSRFSGMILIDTVAQAAPIVEQAEWAGYAIQSARQGVPSVLPNIVPMLLTGNTLLTQPAAGTAIQDIIAEASESGMVIGAEALALRPDYTSLLSTIAVPALVVEGVDDGVYPFPIAQAIQTSIPGSTLSLIPNAAHVSIFEQPDAANQAITAWANASQL
ncbi:MAG: alpha/beta fold hydrolase [Janthinobacterium lividum]